MEARDAAKNIQHFPGQPGCKDLKKCPAPKVCSAEVGESWLEGLSRVGGSPYTVFPKGEPNRSFLVEKDWFQPCNNSGKWRCSLRGRAEPLEAAVTWELQPPRHQVLGPQAAARPASCIMDELTCQGKRCLYLMNPKWFIAKGQVPASCGNLAFMKMPRVNYSTEPSFLPRKFSFLIHWQRHVPRLHALHVVNPLRIH